MRPKLSLKTDPDDFTNYYWLKEELVSFCKLNNLPRSGNKEELTKRIYIYLKTGNVLSPETVKSKKVDKNIIINKNAIIQEGYKNDERHRNYFKAEIGEHFKFNVQFMNWMKMNAGKTYKDAINEWNRIYENKKKGTKTEISSQFEYNQYTRDFYKDNPKAERSDVIKCWKYKKSLPGNNKYEKTDLSVLS